MKPDAVDRDEVLAWLDRSGASAAEAARHFAGLHGADRDKLHTRIRQWLHLRRKAGKERTEPAAPTRTGPAPRERAAPTPPRVPGAPDSLQDVGWEPVPRAATLARLEWLEEHVAELAGDLRWLRRAGRIAEALQRSTVLRDARAELDQARQAAAAVLRLERTPAALAAEIERRRELVALLAEQERRREARAAGAAAQAAARERDL